MHKKSIWPYEYKLSGVIKDIGQSNNFPGFIKLDQYRELSIYENNKINQRESKWTLFMRHNAKVIKWKKVFEKTYCIQYKVTLKHFLKLLKVYLKILKLTNASIKEKFWRFQKCISCIVAMPGNMKANLNNIEYALRKELHEEYPIFWSSNYFSQYHLSFSCFIACGW